MRLYFGRNEIFSVWRTVYMRYPKMKFTAVILTERSFISGKHFPKIKLFERKHLGMPISHKNKNR